MHSVVFGPSQEGGRAEHTRYHLLQTDLVSTIGESVALGAAGIILWGDAAYASSRVSVHMLIRKQNTVIG